MDKPLDKKDLQIPEEELGILETIARRVGGDFNMKIMVGKRGGGSFFNPETYSITFDPLHILTNPNEARFVAGHEGAHRAITKAPFEIGLPTENVKKLYSQIGFGFMHNSIEDPAVNDWMCLKFPGLRELMKEAYDKQLEEDNAELGTPETQLIALKLGRYPRFAQMGSEIIKYWHQNRFSEKLDPDVEKALTRTKDAFETSYKTIPNADSGNTEVVKTSQERFNLNNEFVWPEFQRLVELDLKSEEMRQMLNDESLQDKFDELPDDLKKELGEKLQEALDKLRKELEKQIKEQETLKKEGEEPSQPGQDTNEGNREEPSKLDKLKEQLAELDSDNPLIPYPEDKLSEELKKALKKIFQDLPEGKKKELKKLATKELENIEDDLNKDLESKLKEEHFPSHKDLRDEEKDRESQEEVQKKVRENRTKLEEELKKEREAGEGEYDKLYKELIPIIDALYVKLRNFFIPNRHPRWKKDFPTGSRLSLSRAMQYEADPGNYDKLWERKTVPHKNDYRFKILVDLSGSMQGEKIMETLKGLIVITEVLERLGVKIDVVGFQDRLIPYKSFGEKLDNEMRKKFTSVKAMVYTPEANWNSDGYCLEKTYEDFLQNLGKDNFLVVLSDGIPVPHPNHRGEKYELGKIVNNIAKDRRVKLIGLGLGAGTEHVGNYYPISRPNLKMQVSKSESDAGIKAFPEAFPELIEDMIRHPESFNV